MPSTGGSNKDTGGDDTGHEAGRSSSSSSSSRSGSDRALDGADLSRASAGLKGEPNNLTGTEAPGDRGGDAGYSSATAEKERKAVTAEAKKDFINSSKGLKALQTAASVVGKLGLSGSAAESLVSAMVDSYATNEVAKQNAIASGFSKEKVDAAFKSMPSSQTSISNGADFVENDEMGKTAYDLFNTEMEAATRTEQSLSDQIKGLYEGENAPYDIQKLMQDFTSGVGTAADKYQAANTAMADRWNRFVSDWDNNYQSMSKQYDDLNADYDANRLGYNDVIAQQKKNATGYDELKQGYFDKVNSIPQLNIKMPGSMGGGSFSAAPKNWNNIYSQQAATTGNILAGHLGAINSQGASLADQLASINSKKGAYDSKASLLNDHASVQNTGLANIAGNDQNAYTNAIDALQQKLLPLNTGLSIDDRNKQIQARQALQDSLIDANQGNWADKWAPVAAAVVPTAIDSLSELFKL